MPGFREGFLVGPVTDHVNEQYSCPAILNLQGLHFRGQDGGAGVRDDGAGRQDRSADRQIVHHAHAQIAVADEGSTPAEVTQPFIAFSFF